MKLEPRLPQLPSLGELLDHPRVKAVVGRINRSTIAQRASGFLEELRDSLVERAGRIEVPSVGQLAERLARRLIGPPPATGPAVNATGVVVGHPRWQPPMAERAIHAFVHTAGEYHGEGRVLEELIERKLRDLAGIESAAVFHCFESAVALALADVVEVAPLAGLLDPREFGLAGVDTIAKRLSAGAKLVVVDGAGLIAGPSCGIIAGGRDLVERARQLPGAAYSRCDSPRLAALVETLAIVEEHGPADAVFHLPAWQLLSAPLANLKQRAERLAALMAASPSVASAEPHEEASVWGISADQRLSGPTWQIVITPADGAALTERLRDSMPPIIPVDRPQSTDGVVHLDLRSVFPRWDEQLVAAFA